MNIHTHCNWRHAFCYAALAAVCARADAAPSTTAPSDSASTTDRTDSNVAAVTKAPAAAPPFVGAPALAGDTELDTARGGNGTTVDTRLTGEVSGNVANNVQTGWNVINGGAFANMTGIPIIVQNSGANVLIQNATVIHLQLQ
ncbi:hypothetical protein [Massilia sp. PWRC2]|uniref:hypothetical protein n=1 Tax=Massilia sp. PWRC2 TaxID=2804626 RepID=UPI003CFAAEB5